MRIAVYPGSFDPLHIGHLTFINETLKSKLADKIIVVPTKDYWNKKINTSIEDRLKDIKTIKNKNIITDIKYSSFEYTCQLLDFIHGEYPDDEISLMLGADNLVKLGYWVNVDKILSHHLIIMNRDNHNVDELMHKLNFDNYSILKCDKVDVSSSYIRDNINDAKHLMVIHSKHSS